MRSLVRMSGALLLATVLAGCAGSAGVGPSDEAEPTAAGSGGRVVSHGGSVRDHVSLVDDLRRQGVAVEIAGTARQPFLMADGTRLRLSGGGLTGVIAIESYEYETAAAAEADAAKIGHEGDPQMYRVDWVEPPHFYHSQRVIVIYVGADAGVTGLLSDLLGAQFAGR